MKRVTGIGGIFFKARDATALRDWYRRHLGIDVQPWGGSSFPVKDPEWPSTGADTAWSIFSHDSDYFEPSPSHFMINYRVEDLETVLKLLREEGCAVDERVERSEYGKFGWVMDPEGNRIELWEPPTSG